MPTIQELKRQNVQRIYWYHRKIDDRIIDCDFKSACVIHQDPMWQMKFEYLGYSIGQHLRAMGAGKLKPKKRKEIIVDESTGEEKTVWRTYMPKSIKKAQIEAQEKEIQEAKDNPDRAIPKQGKLIANMGTPVDNPAGNPFGI